ncbi:2-keto-4-pentenoate hydratase [Spongiibacter tropicus]|uniref:2-keto-4-pentenoate hydratase n=1 Tax=Spongiibacter tropicus TaxID=454602 RepID=UPI0003B7B56B|nr:fumarylacetoacetate hydrolase family protein [Spongiibacter tropicus]
MIDSTAQLLMEAYQTTPVAPIRDRFEAGDVASAYAVQQAQVTQWVADGRRPVGRKIGLTSKAVQQQLGVSEPDFGQLFADMVYGSGECVSVGRLQQPRIEAEIALLLKQDLSGEQLTIADVIAATDWVLPALEIVDSRIADWDINIVDTISDNASSGVLVLGGPARRLDGVDLNGCAMTMTINGTSASSGFGRDCLGGPLNAAVWLARKARELGKPLRAGEIILTGALGPMAPIQNGDHVVASVAGIGEVEVTFGP